MLARNNKIKNKRNGSKVTIHRGLTTDELKGIRTTDVQIPKSRHLLRANPGGAIKDSNAQSYKNQGSSRRFPLK